VNADDMDYAEVVFDPEAQLWRVSHRGELVLDSDGRTAGWFDYSAADAEKRRLDPKPAPVFGGWL
jgi:hypothetical protein